MLFVKNHKQKIFNKIRIPASYRSRYEISKNLVDFNNLALLTGRSNASKDMNHFFVSQYCSEVKCAESNRGSIFCPLYLYPVKGELNLIVSDWPAGKSGRVPNLSVEFVEGLAGKVKLDFVSDGRGNLREGESKKAKGKKEIATAAERPRNDRGGTFGPEDVFHYIYAVFHSPEYRRRYAEFLKIDFPRVPMPRNKRLFVKLCGVGQKLVKLHLMESDILEDEKKWPGFDVAGENRVERGYPKYVAHADSASKGKVYINKDQFFEGVRPEVWEFHIGGYQVCEKWLKDRRERKLSYKEISHYQKIVVALGETIRLMKEVDDVMDTHGGWPIE